MQKNIYKIGIIILLLLVVGILGVFLGNKKNVYAGVGENKLKGYAWSDNIGWISFSCANTNSCNKIDYGVATDISGNMSGYAWSDNIGWISFNSLDTVGCPVGSCAAKVTGSSVKGWAKAISADNNGTGSDGGWDGWISLIGFDPSYGVTFDSATGDFSGYAWGEDPIGWIGFSVGSSTPVTIDPGRSQPVVVLDAFPTTVPYNGTTELRWNNKNVSSCWASGGPWSGSWSGLDALGTSVGNIGPIKSSTEYSMTCSNVIGDESTGSVKVTILPADFSLRTSTNIELKGVKGTSTPSIITIDPQNNFTSNISLSVIDRSPALSGAVVNLSKRSLMSSGYGSGVEFVVNVNNPISSGRYFITIQGTGGGLTRTVDVILNVNNEDINFEEF